jgi:hypothetical protein
MLYRVRHLALAAVLGLAALALTASPAQAQFQPNFRRAPAFNPVVRPSLNPYAVNPYQYIPGTATTYRQYAYNTAVLGAAAASIPPWLYGYNPYPQMVNYGPSFSTITPSLGTGYGGSGMGGYGMPMMGGYGGGGSGASLATDPTGYGLSTTGGAVTGCPTPPGAPSTARRR